MQNRRIGSQEYVTRQLRPMFERELTVGDISMIIVWLCPG